MPYLGSYTRSIGSCFHTDAHSSPRSSLGSLPSICHPEPFPLRPQEPPPALCNMLSKM